MREWGRDFQGTGEGQGHGLWSYWGTGRVWIYWGGTGTVKSII